MRHLLDKIWRGDPGPARRLYTTAVHAARQGWLYTDFGVPDTVDGRFDMLSLHLFLLHNRLRGEPGTEALLREVVEIFVADMDQNLRELGVGDPSMGRRVRGMVEALHGRFAAYEAGVDSPDPATLRLALARNVFRTEDPAEAPIEALVDYVRAAAASLAAAPVQSVVQGTASFPVMANLRGVNA